jgi:hypothetical protein
MDDSKLAKPLVLDLIAQRFNNGYSPVVLFCGKMRVGKTTKAYLFAHWLSKLVFNRKWEYKKNTIVSMEQFVSKLANNESEVLLIDECQRIFGKKLWYTKDSILFDTLLTSQAYKHYIILLILPTASNIGTDHAINVNYVVPCSNRILCQPYRVNANEWDIALKQKVIHKDSLGHFDMDINSKLIKEAFKDELEHLEEFKKYIEVNLKKPIMDSALASSSKKAEIDRVPKCMVCKSKSSLESYDNGNIFLCKWHRDYWDGNP